MKNSIRNLIITFALVTGIFGIVNGQVSDVTGEFSTDITIGDVNSFSTPYTGLNLSGDGWELNTNLSDGDVNVEVANYSWCLWYYICTRYRNYSWYSSNCSEWSV